MHKDPTKSLPDVANSFLEGLMAEPCTDQYKSYCWWNAWFIPQREHSLLIILKTMSTMMSSWHGTDSRITSLLWEPPVTGGFSSKGVVIWSFEVCLMSVWTNCWISSPVAVVWALLWRHNGRDGVSNHQPHDCLLNRLFRVQIKENIKAPRHWPSCGELTDDRLTPRIKRQLRGKCSYLMRSSWSHKQQNLNSYYCSMSHIASTLFCTSFGVVV